jgi:ligand-binding sensor protein/putative methionine-R-sulfoxide reductase with GAF domain
MSSSFRDIVDIDNWQTIQNHFSEVLKVTLRTLDKEGNYLTKPSIYTASFEQALTSAPQHRMCYRECLGKALARDESEWKQGYACPLGLHHFLIPLKVKEETLAWLNVGPVIVGSRPTLQSFAQRIYDLGFEPELFFNALREMKVFSFYGIRSVIELLYDIGLCICQLGYQNSQLKGLMPKAPLMLKMLHKFYRERLLSALLEVSCDFTSADRGSIMLLDEENNQLYIKMARGLNESLIDRVRLKVGEGLAGIVAQEQRPLLLDDKVKDERLRRRLNNPRIKRSILIPLKMKNKLLGVLSVASHTNDLDKFSANGMEAIDKLADLVETTLADFPHEDACTQ